MFIILNATLISYITISLMTGRIGSISGLSIYQIIFLVIINSITAGVIEEIIFRGYLLKKVINSVGEKKAIIYTAISFAFIHGPIPDKLLITFVYGAIAAYYYVKEKNLKALIITHIITDIITFTQSII